MWQKKMFLFLATLGAQWGALKCLLKEVRKEGG